MSIPNGYFLGPYLNLLHSWGLIACKHHAPPSSNANHWPLKFCSYRGCLVGYSIPKPNLWELISLFLCDLPLQKHQGWEKSTKDPLRNNWINAFTTVGHTPANHIKELLPITGQSEIDMSLILEYYIFAFRGARHCLKPKSKFHALSKQKNRMTCFQYVWRRLLVIVVM